jgi:cytoplasmic iron level regulating protein YaaA (DUF328/UPF0246 family)
MLKTYPGGIDLGSMSPQSEPLMPAISRYAGDVYVRKQSRIAELLARSEGAGIIIVSALYGLLNAVEPIRDYDLAMTDRMEASANSVHAWWRKRGLGHLLMELVQSFALPQSNVHNLLSGDYQKACPEFCHHFAPRTYRPLAANFDRHEDVKRLLVQHIV